MYLAIGFSKSVLVKEASDWSDILTRPIDYCTPLYAVFTLNIYHAAQSCTGCKQLLTACAIFRCIFIQAVALYGYSSMQKVYDIKVILDVKNLSCTRNIKTMKTFSEILVSYVNYELKALGFRLWCTLSLFVLLTASIYIPKPRRFSCALTVSISWLLTMN